MKRQKKNNNSDGQSGSDKKLQHSLSWISAAIFILGLAVIAGVWLESNSTIGEVRFSGHHFTDTEDLEASFSSPVGLHPDSVRFIELIDSINTLPWIRQAGARVDARGRMTIDVQERIPVARLAKSGHHLFIDSEGVIMPVIPGKPVNVPLLHGFAVESDSEFLAGKEFAHIREFLDTARKNDLAWITISEVAWSQKEGVIALTQENGVKLIFGYGDFKEKLDYWHTFYTEVVREKGIQNFSTVDIRYQNQIVTR